MGQKVHPLGFRVGITKKHQSQWFARFNKHKYAQSVLEDRMLRETLTKLFPQLLNPVLKKVQKRDEESSIVPKITQIKIERGLIPYEIGIQIHAENCDLIKSSIENLKVNRDLLCNLQKTRHYLQHLRSKLNDLNTISESSIGASSQKAKLIKKTDVFLKELPDKKEESVQEGNFANKKTRNGRNSDGLRAAARGAKFQKKTSKSQETQLTKQQFRQALARKRLVLKRLKKRQSIRSRYKQLVYGGKNGGLFLTKKGNKVIQKMSLSSLTKGRGGLTSKTVNRRSVDTVKGPKKTYTSHQGLEGQKRSASLFEQPNIFKLRIKKKFVSVFVNRMNNKFLQALKTALRNCSETIEKTGKASLQKPSVLGNAAFALGVGWNKKWDFKRVQKHLALKSIYQLTKLTTVLEKKSLKKMESLRKDFIALGCISQTEAFNYYQILFFLKQLKEFIAALRSKQRVLENRFVPSGHTSSSKSNAALSEAQKRNQKLKSTLSSSLNSKQNTRVSNALVQRLQSKGNVTEVTMNVLSKKLNNIDNECRKIKFIEYLKQLVKKHRTDNIYLYLSTIADARKDLRKLQQFTKKHASFLFGLNLSSLNSTSRFASSETATTDATLSQKVTERVQNVLQSSYSAQSNSLTQSDFEKTLPEIFLEQIEKQRKMYKDNVQLTPKIAIKFYSVNSKALKAKASVVADSVVDALEKRKAFRKVIKDAKEELMRTQGIKGVKIQLSGRLNGAEIARSEWVRAGRVPLQTLRANLDYSYKTANTIYGIIGVKVWIFKGYTKLI
jgi:ribosomal protein S3